MRDSSQIWERGQLVDVCPAPFHSLEVGGTGRARVSSEPKVDANVAQQLQIGKTVLYVGTYRIQLYNVFLHP